MSLLSDLTPVFDPKDVLVFRLSEFGSNLSEKRLEPGFQVNCAVDFRCNQYASLRFSFARLQLKQTSSGQGIPAETGR